VKDAQNKGKGFFKDVQRKRTESGDQLLSEDSNMQSGNKRKRALVWLSLSQQKAMFFISHL